MWGLFYLLAQSPIVPKRQQLIITDSCPAPAALVPYNQYLGRDIESSIAKVKTADNLTVAKDHTAPNWRRREPLVYNSEGLLITSTEN